MLRQTTWLLVIALFGGCGEPKPPRAEDNVGPVCGSCVAGGEAVDFDGTGTICDLHVISAPVNDDEVEAAGVPAAQTRARLEGSWKAPLRWDDLTQSSAPSPSRARSGYAQTTTIHGLATTTGWTRRYVDPVACPGLICTFLGMTQDCNYRLDTYSLPVQVTVSTDDSSLAATLSGVRTYTVQDVQSDAAGLLDTVHVWTDLTNVSGTLRVTPPQELPYAYLGLNLGYFSEQVRGELHVVFTRKREAVANGFHATHPIPNGYDTEVPLRGTFPDDVCGPSTKPSDMNEPLARMSGKSPTQHLAELRSLFSSEAHEGSWSDKPGSSSTFEVLLEDPEYACVDALGRFTNVPLRLITHDGRLNWSTVATYSPNVEVQTESRVLQLDVTKDFSDSAPIWKGEFQELDQYVQRPLTPVRFLARYLDRGTEAARPEIAFTFNHPLDCVAEDCEAPTAPNALCFMSPPVTGCNSPF